MAIIPWDNAVHFKHTTGQLVYVTKKKTRKTYSEIYKNVFTLHECYIPCAFGQYLNLANSRLARTDLIQIIMILQQKTYFRRFQTFKQ